MKKRSWVSLIIAVVMIAALVVACAPTPTPPPTPPPTAPPKPAELPLGEELRIGVAAPLSGPAVPWGYAQLRPVQLWAEEINAEGGFVAAGERHMIKVISYDHKYRADEAATVVRRLIMVDKCPFISVLGGGVMPAVSGMIQDNDVLCFAVAFGLGVLDPDYDHIWVTLAQPVELAYVWKWMAENHPEIKKVGMLAVNDNVGRMSGLMVERRTEEFGQTCVGVEYYERDVTDFTALLSRILAEDPDIIDMDGSPAGTAALIIKQARELGFTGPIIHGGHTDPAIITKMVGEEKAEGLYCFDATIPELEPYKEKYVKRFGDWDNMAPGFGRYAWILLEAIKRADSLDPYDVKAVLESPDFTYEDLTGKGRFYGKDEPLYNINHNSINPLHLQMMHEGKMEYVGTILPPQL